MKLVLKIFLISGFLLCLQSLFAQNKKLRVVAYYAGGHVRLDSFEVGKLTDIIYSFGHLQGDSFHISSP